MSGNRIHPDGGPPYFECVAVSTGPDPTGSYYQYEFPFGSDFPDYPKLGVWPDAYYMTTRNFANGSSFTGVQAVAFERAAMLNGDPAQMVVFDVGNPVSGAQVFGTFSGDFNETASGFTGPNGTVTLVTVGTKQGSVNFSFCVDNVAATLPYDPNDNANPAFACP